MFNDAVLLSLCFPACNWGPRVSLELGHFCEPLIQMQGYYICMLTMTCMQLHLFLVPFGWVSFQPTGCSLTRPTVTEFLLVSAVLGGLFNHPCFGAVRVTHATTEPSPPRGVSLINTVVKVNAFHFLAALCSMLADSFSASVLILAHLMQLGLSRWPFGPDCSGCLL